MKHIIFKHRHLYTICFLVCIIFLLPLTASAQNTKRLKAQKKDSIVKTSFFSKKKKKIQFNGSDGPYIINDTLYRVTSESKLLVTPFFNRDSLLISVDDKAQNKFYIALTTDYEVPKTVYNLPEKLVVISDIEGNFNAFASFLQANHIIDDNYNWIFNNGHLVLGGDFVDRGKNVTQVLWLIYKLDQQAKAQNGQVHFILGNHEILNFQGDYRYNRGKYIKAAQEISQLNDKTEATKFLYSDQSELGKWLATKNVIEKIGDYIFVHAGLSEPLLEYTLSLEDINNIARFKYNGLNEDEDKTVAFLYSSKGPFWYRGLVMDRSEYSKIEPLALHAILNYYDAKKIIIGHTPVKEISSDFDGRVIRTDVHHGKTKFSGKTKGLLIENNAFYIIDDSNNKAPLINKL
ncbi:metallophosphoesterase [Lacinutrix salivirga]